MASTKSLVRVPPRHRDGIRKLIQFPTPKIEALCNALEALPLTLFSGESTTAVVGKALSVDPDEARQFAEILSALYFLLAQSNEVVEDFARELVPTLPIDPNDVDSARWTQNLSRLLSVESFFLQQNATGLLYDRQNLFTDARILTDIRPVFPRQLEGNPPAAWLIVHTLKISYHNSSGRQETFLAIDSDDLDVLSRLLERAKQKAAALRTAIDQTAIPIIEGSE